MTKQEEIREGIGELIGNDVSTVCAEYGGNASERIREKTKEILLYLHSQGVVIKVDKKIEECCDCCEYNEWDDDGRCKVSGTYDEDRCWMWSCKTSYVAVEPLIEGE